MHNSSSPDVIIFPGFGDYANNPSDRKLYEPLVQAAQDIYATENVHLAQISWESGTFEAWREEALTQVVQAKKLQAALGFSCGALLALEASATIPTDDLTLISTSAWTNPETMDIGPAPLTPGQLESMARLSIDDMVRRSLAKRAFVFYGQDEIPPMIRHSKHIANEFGERAAASVLIPHAAHPDMITKKNIDQMTQIITDYKL